MGEKRAWLSLALCAASLGWAGDAVVPRELEVDPATLENQGFRWYIEGDDNRNARVDVEWREKGAAWRKGHPLLRVNEEVVNRDYQPHKVGRLFAGSLLFLKPGTGYEVKLVMSDPDGAVRVERLLTFRTRDVPEKPAGGKRREVGPKEGVAGLKAALAAAEPGDRIVLRAGMYVFRETWRIEKSGTAERPIVIEAAGDGEVIWHGSGFAMDLVNVERAGHLWLDGLTMQSARHAVMAGKKGERGASGLTVTRSRIRGVVYGIRTESEYSEG